MSKITILILIISIIPNIVVDLFLMKKKKYVNRKVRNRIKIFDSNETKKILKVQLQIYTTIVTIKKMMIKIYIFKIIIIIMIIIIIIIENRT